MLAFAGAGAGARQFVPPAGYTGTPGPGVVSPAEPGTPALRRIPDADLAGLFKLNPTYSRAANAHLKVVGAFEVAETSDVRLVDAWAPGFLPVTLKFSDGRCFSLAADYTGGTLSNGRLHAVSCGERKTYAPSAAKPADASLRYIGGSWGYGAWTDDKTGTTLVSAPETETFEPLFTTKMAVNAIMAMNGIDWPGGNITLVGRIDGRLTVVTLEVGF